MLTLGCASFALMLLGDINDALWHKKVLRAAFPLGLIALAAATALRCSFSRADGVWCLIAAVFAMLLAYVLFGSFSVNDAYIEQGSGRKVCDTGFYAVCRHPGVLFFAAMYASLHCALALPWTDIAVYSVLNVILAAVEDVWIFPCVLDGYAGYKNRVPFLIPGRKNIKKIFSKQ